MAQFSAHDFISLVSSFPFMYTKKVSEFKGS